MSPNKKSLAAPILIIALGVGWLLTTQNFVPGVNWIWILGLGITGVLILVRSIDKVTIVVGPFLIAASAFSILRQTGRMSVDTEVPSLVIVFGSLMLIATILPIPLPSWMIEPPKSKS
jgi:hypothetical protein